MSATALVLAALAAATSTQALRAPDTCALTASDRAWLERSVDAWSRTRRSILHAPAPRALDAVIFDQNCVLTSRSAMVTGYSDWSAQHIAGGVVQIGAQEMPVGVMSATIGDDRGTRFVMSAPSVWAKNGVTPGPLGLERLMTAVMMHEATHVFQMGTYGRAVDRLQKDRGLNDDQFNDDAIQALFEGDAAFSASIRRETELFFAAAQAPDEREARRLAGQARAMMRARAARYFVGEQAYQVRAEDLWLTMEGSAQWAGYRWLRLSAPAGGGASEDEAMAGFGKRGKSWTQLEGLAIAMTVARLRPAHWERSLFGDGRYTLLELLDRSIAPTPAR